MAVMDCIHLNFNLPDGLLLSQQKYKCDVSATVFRLITVELANNQLAYNENSDVTSKSTIFVWSCILIMIIKLALNE